MAAYLIKIGKRPFLYRDSYGPILVVIVRLLHCNHPKPTVLYVPQYVANFVSKKSCSI